ncbi:MAG: sigma-70 family RNA polymerase sigma factor [Bacteroidales bacterium]|nr:sigma-70 family RNA polymerase sigma factor [Bacteroidales bacterium]
MKEEELVSLCRQGDRAAFAALFREYSPVLMGVCRRYTVQEEDSREVLQEGFEKIIEGFSRFEYRGEGSLRAWMSRVMMNRSLAYMKKKRRTEYLNEPLYDNLIEDPVMVESDDPETGHIPEEVMMGFIMNLPPGCRTVLNMYLFEELDHSEIAETLNISKEATAARLYRARTLLKGMIGNYLKNGK